MNKKYIFITGGVTSSLGKGIVSASLGMLLKYSGYRVTILKMDPYLNIDPGTMNPYEHGECFVTTDGAETDLDLGHYERFLNQNTTKKNSITSGLIYKTVIDNERKGNYLGKTVQVIPHITNEIKRRIKIFEKSNNYDIIITEIGGTVGDIEILPYVESVRQLKWELGKFNVIIIHLTLLPYISSTGEIKTKPTQHSVRKLMENGIQADIIICRTKKHISKEIKKKLALFCNVNLNNVIEAIDTEIIYEIPCLLNLQKFDKIVLDHLNLKTFNRPNFSKWNIFINKYRNPKYKVKIALVGKYIKLHDAYKSIEESLIHAGTKNEIYVKIKWICSETINNENVKKFFSGISGILIAPGFGNRGIEGKILAAKYARENMIPFLGICLGMQIAVIEFARNVLGLKNANSYEINPLTSHPVINIMEQQKKVIYKGGTMRLGDWKCSFIEGSKLFYIYNRKKEVYERHRHRYEFNNDYLKFFSNAGMNATGINPDTGLVEAFELKDHIFFLCVQYHPEYKSTVINPHPLFINFVKISKNYKSFSPNNFYQI
ncbi:CTP synthase [Blattabacterium cuenoti]|uniref:CTP synthase n=1 Tax=Blattabacterium cuenoti TaxID=1653831 RepID=UPI00163C7095|nr:CTP synthase [Blattabacterium cuenoti]